MDKFKCIVLTEVDIEVTSIVNSYCRTKKIIFLMADVCGLAGWCFVDFADRFEVIDLNGEEASEQFIGNMTKVLLDKNDTGDEHGIVVHTIDNRRHDLETGDHVSLSEIAGLSELNGKVFAIRVIDSTSFSLVDCVLKGDDAYKHGGIFKQAKIPKIFDFKSFDQQLYKPDVVYTNFADTSMAYYLHASLIACKKPSKTFESFQANAKQALDELAAQSNTILARNPDRIFQTVFSTSTGRFPPLCALYGGIVAQEVIKGLTNKFTPIQQWLHLDCIDLYESMPDRPVALRQDRYDVLRICLGNDDLVARIRNSKVFMVGCGAIGCEMLKNLALLGVGCDVNGLVTITDNDLIEKSNLNRQFLFRPGDIRKAKSQTAADAIRKINPDMRIKVFQDKICPQTEKDVFTDGFFVSQDVCINALDNVEARQYMDSRCVTNQIALLESGTLGTKGHVQVIVPHLTESYTTQQDPQDESVPYCTLKSFPSNIEHCIQWARDKFESSFTIKPNGLRKFLVDNKSWQSTLNTLESQPNTVIDGSVQCAKFMRDFCLDWHDCIRLARIKFEKYFSNKAKNLLHAYPLEHTVDGGSTPFWKLPKRPPHALKFNIDNDLHVGFIMSCAKLYAHMYAVNGQTNGDPRQTLVAFEPNVPEWRPLVTKKILIDEKISKEELLAKSNSYQSTEYDNLKCAQLIRRIVDRNQTDGRPLVDVMTLHFEKDNDSNGHIDFIHAASNLRACMYSIDNSDRLKVKKIAGKIVPAIATTTACIGGFVSIEYVKAVKMTAQTLESYRNVFVNLGLAMVLVSEPGACKRTQITEKCSVTLWDKWCIKGHMTLTLQKFIDTIKDKYKLTPSGIMNGSKVIWLPVMPGHAKRLNEPMIKLIKGLTAATHVSPSDYVDLSMTYSECDEIDNGNRNNLCPPVRYYFC